MAPAFNPFSYSDAIYSHYEYVKSRIKTLNANRLVQGLLSAADWPPTNIKLEAFYLLDLKDANNRNLGTKAQRGRIRFLQWVWVVQGTTLGTQSNIKLANRGDRFVVHQTMSGEMVNGLYPGFAPKYSWARDGNGVWTPTAKTPPSTVTWSAGEPSVTRDKGSGLIYGYCTVDLVDVLDEIPV